MIPPPPLPSSVIVQGSSSKMIGTTQQAPGGSQPPPPPSSMMIIPNQKKKLIIEKKKEEKKINEMMQDPIEEKQFVIDPSMVVKDKSIMELGLNQNCYDDLKILLVTTFSRPNHSAKVLEESIQNSILESGRCPDIVLCPEGWHASPLMTTPDRNIVMNKDLESMCQVMKNHKCYGFIGVKVWGVDEKLKPINKFYNSMIVINPNGEVLGCYRKRVPTSAESSTPGDRVGIFDTIYGRIAVLICFDIENQVILEEVLAYKPFLILNPTYIGATGLHDNTLSKKSNLMMENEEKSRRFQVKISLEALGRNFEKVCKDNNVSILRCDTPVHYGGRGTHQLMTPYSTIYPPSFYAENSFSFYVDKVDLTGNTFSENTEAPERERTHNEDNVGTRYTLFSNSHQDIVLRSEKLNPKFKVTFFNHNRLICCDERSITVVNTDILACENFSLDHVSISIDSDGNFTVNNNSVINEEIRIVDIWARFDKKHLVVLMSDGNVGLFKVLDEERLKVSNNSILCLEKQFKLENNLIDQDSRIVAPNNNMLFITSRNSIVKLGNLSGGEFIGKTFSLENELSVHVSISDNSIEYLSLTNKSINLIALDFLTGESSISNSVNLDVESDSLRLESSLEANSFFLSEFDPNNMNSISITPIRVQNHQITLTSLVKLPENSTSILSLNSSKFICGQQDGSLKLLDTSSSSLIRHKFHPYPSLNSSRVVSFIHDKQNGRLVSIHQHKNQTDGHLLCMAKFGNNRFVANLTTLFK